MSAKRGKRRLPAIYPESDQEAERFLRAIVGDDVWSEYCDFQARQRGEAESLAQLLAAVSARTRTSDHFPDEIGR